MKPDALPILVIQLLGDFHLTYDGQPLNTVNQARVQSLLAYLLLHRHAAQARHHLAFTFWPDVGEAQARNNLRQMLHQLRHALPAAGFLQADSNTVQWSPSAPYRLDVAGFEEAAAHSANLALGVDKTETCRALQVALDLYTGELLPSCYDDWITPEREHLHQQAFTICRQLIPLLEERREYTAALDAARRLLQLDPLDEATYAILIRLHALNNDRAGALRVYHDCVTILQRELEVEPGDELQAAYKRMLHVGTVATAFAHAPSSPGAIPLVGRQGEWEQMRALWHDSTRGQPSFALITGDAGIGKTRLAEELFVWLARQGIAVARTRAYAAEGRLSYAPIIEWLRSPALAPALARLDKIWLGEIARLLPELLTSQRNLPAPVPRTEYWQRQRFYEALARGILAVDAPLLLLIDDLQWCDQETLEWLHFLLRFDPKARLLVAGTARSEEINANPALSTLMRALQSASQLHQITLYPLDAAEVARLAGRINHRELESAETLHLFRESEGNPLFVVEMVRAGLPTEIRQPQEWRAFAPSTHGKNTASSLPPRIYALIAGRLDQLSNAARELIGVAATIGRAFTFEVLAGASGKDEETVIDALDELWQRRIVREQGAHAYDFSHDKLRDVAYNEISPMQVRRLHRRVALALEETHAADLDPVSAQLAAQYESAGLPLEAVGYYRRAGAVAQRVHANAEAITLYNKGIAGLAALPGGLERLRLEQALQTAIVVPLAAYTGYSTPELMAACERSRDLADKLGEAPDPAILRALAIGCVGRLWFKQAQALGEQLLALAGREDDSVLFTEAYYVLGVTSFFQGEFSRAHSQLEQAIAHYDVANSPVHITRYAQDPRVVCLCRLALVLWYLGYPDQAVRISEEALAFARALAHPFSLVYCLYWNALVQQHCGHIGDMLERVQEAIDLAYAQELGLFAQYSLSLQGWALAQGRDPAAGIAQLRKSIDLAHATGAEYVEGFNWILLAGQIGRHADIAQGLQLVDDVLAMIEQTGSHWCKAEALRCKGELLLLADDSSASNVAAAEALLRQALAVAGSQGAKGQELRAALGLARLWQSVGRGDEARRLLAPVYEWFTEGVDLPDMQEADALLAVLQPDG